MQCDPGVLTTGRVGANVPSVIDTAPSREALPSEKKKARDQEE